MQKIWQQKIKNNPELYKNRTTTQIGYWLKKGHSEEEAKKLLKERQATNTLKTYITKYGDKGYEKWKKRNSEWSANLEKKYKNGDFVKYNENSSNLSSKVETEFFNHIITLLKGNKIKWRKQFRISKLNGGYYMYDFRFSNKIIEFNGDF